MSTVSDCLPVKDEDLEDEPVNPIEGKDGLPFVVLPSRKVTNSECAAALFCIIAPTRKLFVRGGVVVHLVERDDGPLALAILTPAEAVTAFEKFAIFFVWRTGRDGGPVLKPTTCSEQLAKYLLLSEEAKSLLPSVAGLSNCPIIREDEHGELTVVGKGYDEVTKLLITGGEIPSEPKINFAVEILLELLDDFEFQSAGDKSRALISLITPAIKAGGLIKGRVPADVAEADQSQSGKTYRQKVIAAIYNERMALVTSRKGGAGSMDESFSQRLIDGHPFIQFDNLRGKLDSAHLEAFLTADGPFPCRVPYRPEITVDPENYFVFLSSNGVDTTRDLANRSNIIRNKKKPAGFVFKELDGGDLLSHVRKWQAQYLGSVFAVIREWHRLGKQRTNETRHDFREWAQVADWIARHIMGLHPIMDGHQDLQERVSNPALGWLRQVVLAVIATGEIDQGLTATRVYELCESCSIDVPGLRPGADEDRGKRTVGGILGKLFGDANTLEVEGYTLTRGVHDIPREDGNGNRPLKTYTVTNQFPSTPQPPQP